ncbi:GNAT family N-acetyltransferase [Streptomyces sp. N2-109]|uniref:GNAT family N-acetyltransferase n=1 Tax=Streptomyces gossypii TaxID=2883101 RepID=A0ABT2JLY8_9ACTN|nr:GNAT family N-acetyltransferase [Streptomyces gossypii]MCT2588385.1 GNAT family N-acetyltransferase [Streptomyces gossypii]
MTSSPTCPRRCGHHTWTVEPISYDAPQTQELLLRLHDEQTQLYGFADHPADNPAHHFAPPHGLFLIAHDRTTGPVACGGWRLVVPQTAEIKGMYVAPAARGQTLGRTVLRHLETDAQLRDVTRIQLERGAANLVALALYRSHGYTPVPSYRTGRDPRINRAFSKPLTPSGSD